MREEMLKSITKKNKISEKINFGEIAKKTPGYLALIYKLYVEPQDTMPLID